MWSYFQGFKVLFFSRSACILPRVLRSKPLKISPLQALGGISFEISSFEEQPLPSAKHIIILGSSPNKLIDDQDSRGPGVKGSSVLAMSY